jgi:TolB-like protein
MSSFFTELKRRNVIRVGIAYVVGSWLLVQGADLIFDLIGADDWVLRAVASVLALGFIPVVVFAWAYELTPEGLKKEKDIDRSHSVTQQTAKKLDIATMGLLLAAIGLLALDRALPEKPAAESVSLPGSQSLAEQPTTNVPGLAAATKAEPNSIAVLPFADLSAEGDQEYFSDGISEELLNLLVRVDGLKVASRTSSFAYKGLNSAVPQIASELKVANILEGSVRKSGNRIRITAQLIDTQNDRHLWSETYDRDLVDIFAIQDEIASSIVTALKQELGIDATVDEVVVTADTANLDAYELYLKGRTLFTARQRIDEAIALFQRAIELDPMFARAWEGLAAAEAVADDWLATDGIDHLPLAIAAAEKAIELDPDLSMPYAVLGNIETRNVGGENIPDAAQANDWLNLSLEKDPNNTTAWLWRGIQYNNMGFPKLALADFDECLARDPAYLNCVQHRAAALLYMGKTQAALDVFVPTLYKNFHSMDEAFVSVLVEQGNSLAAVSMATARIAVPDSPVGLWIEALENPQEDQSARLAELDRWVAQSGNDIGALWPDFLVALHDYERAIQYPYLRFTLFAPASKALRQTPWFKQFAKKMGYEAYWRANGFPPSCKPLDEQDYACD